MSYKKTNRKYKDSVFTKLFGEKNNLIELIENQAKRLDSDDCLSGKSFNRVNRGSRQAHSSEVRNMLLSEWNLADAQRVWKEEGIAVGIAEGKAEGIAIGESRGIDKLLSLLRQGYSVDEAEKQLLSKKPRRR